MGAHVADRLHGLILPNSVENYPMAMTPAEIELNLARSTDELLAELGRSVEPPRLGARERTFAEYFAGGQKWLDDRRIAICEALRQSSKIVSFVNGQSSFRNTEAAGICIDILSTVFGRGLPVCWASITLIKTGTLTFCSWTPPVSVAGKQDTSDRLA
jgi:hypothetical protein